MKKSYLSLLVLSALAIPAIADTSIDQMFSQGTLKGELRLFDFTRDFDDSTNTKHDTSFGGLFYYNTAKVNGISFGTSFASANPIWTNDSDDVYGLVARDANGNHDSVNRLQEYFVQELTTTILPSDWALSNNALLKVVSFAFALNANTQKINIKKFLMIIYTTNIKNQ